MKKFLLSALMGVLGLTAMAGSDAQVTFGYCNDEFVWVSDGLKDEQDMNFGLEIRLPARNIINYKGGKIVGLQIGASSDAYEHEVHAFLRTKAPNGEIVTETTDYIGWEAMDNQGRGKLSDILFDKEWTIPEDLKNDLYVGLYTHIPADKAIIGFSANQQVAPSRSVYVAYTYDQDVAEPTEWADITTLPFPVSNFAIKCIIELPAENYQNVLMIENGYMPNICKADDTTTGLFYLRNEGLNEVKSFELTTTCGEQSLTSRFVYEDEGIKTNFTTPYAQPFPVPVFGTGHYKVEITKVNDEENTAADKRAAEFDIVAVPAEVAEKHVRRPLYEYYTSENDHLSAINMDDCIRPVMQAFKGRFTFLAHHTNDKFAQNPVDVPSFVEGEQGFVTLSDADYWAMHLCNGFNDIMMPSAPLDRTVHMNKVIYGGRAVAKHSMTITPTPQMMLADGQLMNQALSIPTFASVELDNKYNADTNTLEVKASGTIADLLPEGEKAKLQLFLIEESILSDSQEFQESASTAIRYPDGTYTHPRVIRQNITADFWGDELEPGQDFLKTYTCELESTRWNPDHMKVVAVIARPETNDYLHMDVLNSAEKPITDTYEEPSAIATVEVENVGGNAIYDLQGRKLNVASKGINIINGKKVLVK